MSENLKGCRRPSIYNTFSSTRVQACVYPRILSTCQKQKRNTKKRVQSPRNDTQYFKHTRTFFSFITFFFFILVRQTPKGFCQSMCMWSLYRWILVFEPPAVSRPPAEVACFVSLPRAPDSSSCHLPMSLFISICTLCTALTQSPLPTVFCSHQDKYSTGQSDWPTFLHQRRTYCDFLCSNPLTVVLLIRLQNLCQLSMGHSLSNGSRPFHWYVS